MAMFTMDRSSKKRLLFDVTTRTIRSVTSSVFPDATCAFENGGWLLMLQRNNPPPLGFVEQHQAAVFLLHPTTGTRLDLPPLSSSSSSSSGLFVFYVNSHGAPLVVARVEAISLVPTVHVACPGDLFWSVYKHDVDVAAMEEETHQHQPWRRQRRRRLVEPVSIADVALVGTQAVCLDAGGEVLGFDVAEMTWRRRTPAVIPDSGGIALYARSLVAAGGEVVLVSRPRGVGLEWSPMERRELDDTRWFFRKGQSFRAMDPGKRRVYVFGGGSTAAEASVAGGSSGLKSTTNVYGYDLDDAPVEMVIPASIVTEGCRWVRPSVLATSAAT
nr:unnamed protein product [Digitaria exilis]